MGAIWGDGFDLIPSDRGMQTEVAPRVGNPARLKAPALRELAVGGNRRE